MATVSPRKRRPKPTRTTPKPGKESWRVIGPNGEVLLETGYGEGATLGMAQTLAQKYDEEITLTVEWKALFGEPDTLYRVVREEDGSITTWRT